MNSRYPNSHDLQRSRTRRATLATAIGTALVAACVVVPAGHARTGGEVMFNEAFATSFSGLDMAQFSHGNPVEPGVYLVDVQVNGERLRRMDITFVESDTPNRARPCLPLTLLRELGLKNGYLPAADEDDGAQCLALETVVEGARADYHDNILLLDLSIPQAALQQVARGFVAPEQRDYGINAAFVNYHASSFRNAYGTSSSLALDAGVNLGAWRLRHRSSIAHTRQGTETTVLSNYLQRDIPQWNSQLLLGEGNTGGQLFDSIGFTGLRVATDERMLPDSVRGYAPVVRGIAQSNAQVTIRQNGNVIQQINVAPGPFVIDDLYATSGNGDLEVTVTEADGQEERFTVAFAAVPQALREGDKRFSATLGELRESGRDLRAVRFAEATYARGINNGLTLLGGTQVATGYQSALIGAAVNTGLGAFGADVTYARTRTPSGAVSAGQSLRLNYQRNISSTGTHFGLAAYRYSTAGFLSLNDAAQLGAAEGAPSPDDLVRPRNRLQLNFSQQVGERSQLYLTGGHTGYWNSAQSQSDLQLGFYSSWRNANYTVSATRYRTPNAGSDTRLAFTLRMPLGRSSNAPRISGSVNHYAQGAQYRASVNGALGDAQNLSYSLGASDGPGGHGYDANASYQGGRGNVGVGYSRSAGRSSLSLAASGGVVLHGGGVSLGAELGDSFAIVEAKGAEGARVQGGRPVTIARNGYAVLAYTNPYRWNTLELDTSMMPLDLEVESSSMRVAPTAGSIVKVAFSANRQRTLFIDATDEAGQPLPFAAAVAGADGRALGYVGQGGIIQLRDAGLQESAWVAISEGERCRLDYTLPEQPDAHGLYWTSARCVRAAALPSSAVDAQQNSHDPLQ